MSTEASAARLRASSPAPATSATASAISATTKALRAQTPRGADRRPLAAFTQSGAQLHPRGLQRRRQSEDDARGQADQQRRTAVPQIDVDLVAARQDRPAPSPSARPRPAAPARRRRGPTITPSRRLSVSSWRISRHRLAPTAARTTISRARADDRASSRLATLAQAISSTTADAFRSMSNIGLAVPDHADPSAAPRSRACSCWCPGIPVRAASQSRGSRPGPARRVTPSFSRAIAR